MKQSAANPREKHNRESTARNGEFFPARKKIHGTGLNPNTPVVFVTSHDDSEARSQAADSGGCGFIPKPVLASQITLTALTFILRTRLHQSAPVTDLKEAACLEMV